MPSQPSAARRRFHTDRVIAKRIRQARALSSFDSGQVVNGRLENEQWYRGCHGARCGLCHPEKHCSNGDRQRERRVWRDAEAQGW